MNVFLVGNGFDLHHMFPTSYINFLHTLKFLTEKYDDSFKFVGQVFGDSELQESDSFIHKCYKKHSRIYDSTPLPYEKVLDIVTRAKENIWFKYLCNCVTKDINWIDFEKEILRVLEAFDSFFNYENELIYINGQVVFDFSRFPSNIEDRHILSQFDFFFKENKKQLYGCGRAMCVEDEYVIEKVVGSKLYHIKIDGIVSNLYLSLRDLADILRVYLLLFVDGPAVEYKKLDVKLEFLGMPVANRVYSFNYTNTFEILYSNDRIDHIHGNTNTDIVLGINPDERDEIYNVDTTFLQFKKYFQRVFFKTDNSFLQHMTILKNLPRGGIDHVFVIGHSLDSTDEDVIKQIFQEGDKITVLYHDETSVKNQITNLVKIYGKESFDRLREDKELQFILQSEINWEFPAERKE